MSLQEQVDALRAENAELARRIGGYERRRRSACGWAVVAVVALVGAGAAGSGGGEVAEVVRAKRIEVVDGDGKVRVVLGEVAASGHDELDAGGTGVGVFDKAGTQRLRLTVVNDPSLAGLEGVVAFSSDGSHVARLNASPHGAGVSASRSDEPSVAELGTGGDVAFVRINDGDTKNGIALHAKKGVPAELRVLDPVGATLFKAP